MNFEGRVPLHLVFLHLDLGIGGAEQLFINLCIASLNQLTNIYSNPLFSTFSLHFDVYISILTTHKSTTRCFEVVCKGGKLFPHLNVVGSFIPTSIFGTARVLCSTVRMFYLCHVAISTYPQADVFVIDVLPTPIPYMILKGAKSNIYYCHFPDKLLNSTLMDGIKKKKPLLFEFIYRYLFDLFEEWSLPFSDVICFNSNFTKVETYRAFPSFLFQTTKLTATEILYPAIEFSKFTSPHFVKNECLSSKIVFYEEGSSVSFSIISLSRFEKKKNTELLLTAYARLMSRAKKYKVTLPELVIAGGLDPYNRSNYRYFLQLQKLSRTLEIDSYVYFRPNISDKERVKLLQSALCLAYTPDKEHFGIVPLEAMYVGVPVVALSSGGLNETIINEMTGLFVDPINNGLLEKFENTLWMLIKDPTLSVEMGKNGHEHVKEIFSWKEFELRWMLLIEESIKRGKLRRKEIRSKFFSICRFEDFFVIIFYLFFFQLFIEWLFDI